MMADWWWVWLGLFFGVAMLYGAVGHGGASGYLAVMALAGFAPVVMRPTALTLNIAVSLVGAVWFYRAGHFRWSLFWPFALSAIPAAFIGGQLHLPPGVFKILLAIALSLGALRLLQPDRLAGTETRRPPVGVALAVGAVIGLVSGLIGVGGGIFLTPLLLLFRWSEPKTAAAVSAPFILVNSLAGLAGAAHSLHHLPTGWYYLALGVVLGGALGARWGSGRARAAQLRPVLAGVLGLAALKLVLG